MNTMYYLKSRVDMYMSKLPKACMAYLNPAYLKINHFKKYLAQYGSHPTKFTPGLWTHEKKLIKSTLVVDEFSIKYNNK